MKQAVQRPAQRAGKLFSPPSGNASAHPSVYLPTGVTPAEGFAAIGRLRKEAQTEIDRLLAFLDATEADADLEPWLGIPEVDPGRLAPGDAGSGVDDREADDDHEDAGRALS